MQNKKQNKFLFQIHLHITLISQTNHQPKPPYKYNLI